VQVKRVETEKAEVLPHLLGQLLALLSQLGYLLFAMQGGKSIVTDLSWVVMNIWCKFGATKQKKKEDEEEE